MPLTGEMLQELPVEHDCELVRKDEGVYSKSSGTVWRCECGQEWVVQQYSTSGVRYATWYKKEFYLELLDKRSKT